MLLYQKIQFYLVSYFIQFILDLLEEKLWHGEI